jgi:two-component system, OmpR family, response regulator
MRILVVEDDRLLRHTLVETLRDEGYAVDAAADGEEGLYKIREGVYDAVILDVMLPLRDGWEILQQARPACTTPILMLTARDTVHDRVKGLNLGADDYLSKPFDSEELLARVRALIRRAANKPQSRIQFHGIELDAVSRKIRKDGIPIELTAREYQLLEYLAFHMGQVVSRSTLYEHLFDENEDSLSNLLDVHISNLRRKLGKPIITTRRGQGYCIE